ncbi:Mechanosensitive ion channel [Solimonas aquatica]|uniref:Mechanosensitive ion channel n=1 Tax=Solimonas aquatica TaxID=489703 RepID=A0A1H9I293_9GAMM|nr:mechanosensitive ion channel domain-containing protein [Solimonas aquatica]SEQ68575.1 Mechanosensitive ion channel [Solimonas aquatica]
MLRADSPVLVYLGQQPLLWTAATVVLTALATWALQILRRTLNDGRYAWQQRLRAALGVAAGKRLSELLWLLVAFNFLLWTAAVYLVLHIWGLHDEGERLGRALFSTGVPIGGVRLVLGKLLIGVTLFAVLFTLTRWLTRRLERDWLVRAGIEASTRDAVATLFGYVTFVMAVVVGLSTAGVDLSKLAIVAGALSVGIGFGLQNIVSNFVSGLILLFERPIRSGDTIQVGATQGVVRKIRIRATEIETGEFETVIVPNSDLLSNHVRNRDLRSRLGKLSFTLTVAHGNDARKVQALLLDVLRGHEAVIGDKRVPGVSGPAVQLIDINATGLQFELGAVLFDGGIKGAVASELRFAIEEVLRREGVTLPAPRRDAAVAGEAGKS